MPILLFILLIFGFVYAEFSLIVWIGSHLGILTLILLLLGSFLIGMALLSTRSLYATFQVRKELAQGQIPTQSLLKSGTWIAAAVLFMIPGFLTDLLALFLMSPFGEYVIGRWVNQKVRSVFGRFFVKTHGASAFYQSQSSEVFDAEFEHQVDEDKRLR